LLAAFMAIGEVDWVDILVYVYFFSLPKDSFMGYEKLIF
jgi:hypothetical protein